MITGVTRIRWSTRYQCYTTISRVAILQIEIPGVRNLSEFGDLSDLRATERKRQSDIGARIFCCATRDVNKGCAGVRCTRHAV
jgi:hypothetical protein